MHEIDVLAIGEETRSGDAIALRFDRPDGLGRAHVLIDAGFQSSGEDIVSFIQSRYDTSHLDLAVLTHPDRDHIGGMQTVLESLNVDTLALHRLAAYGGESLPASEVVEGLCDLADHQDTEIVDVFQGRDFFGGALLVAGPSVGYYQDLVSEQVEEADRRAVSATSRSALSEAVAKMAARILSAFPLETDFDDAGGTNPRNNSSAIVDLRLESTRMFFPGDAGTPAIIAALDYLSWRGREDIWPSLIVEPHHGSRHNLDRDTIQRLAGPGTDDARGSAVISIARAAAEDPRYPSPRVSNAFGRRGYAVVQTAGGNIRWSSPDAPARSDYHPMSPLGAMDESIDDR